MYRLQCLTTGQCYVGSTSKAGNIRINQHFHNAHSRRLSGQLYADMRQYGREGFVVTTLEEWPSRISRLELCKREQHWMNQQREEGITLYNRNRAHKTDQDTALMKQRYYVQVIKDKIELCGCGGSYCPTNRYNHRTYSPHLNWERQQLLHLSPDIFA